MLTHARPETDTRLANVFGVGTAAAGLLVNSFLIKFVRFRFVLAAEDVSQFSAWFRMVVNIVPCKDSF